jgi:ribonuclease BN (tRNA processing enzyme)
MTTNRRDVVLGLAGAAAITPVRTMARPMLDKGAHVVLLGTKGGPVPSLAAGEPANALVVDGVPYVIDCGNGVAFQLLKAGFTADQVPAIFITHHHFDHNADMGTLIMTAWQRGRKERIDLIAPPPARRMMDHFLSYSAPDIDVRVREEGRARLATQIEVHEVSAPGTVFEDERIKVRATIVDHYLVKPALAYRFDTADRSVVFSGDTRYSPALCDLARGADILVHEAIYMPALAEIGHINAAAPTMAEHLERSHTAAEDAGRLAQEAGVKLLVLNHLVPSDRYSDSVWIDTARRYFTGEVAVGHDLLVF